jgi:hypothetical protein
LSFTASVLPESANLTESIRYEAWLQHDLSVFVTMM